MPSLSSHFLDPASASASSLRSNVERPVYFHLADIPQAFSHFNHSYSGRKMVVCDLQGVYSETNGLPTFQLTDPVIHYKSTSGHKSVGGRTDRGDKGINQFFRTYKCSEICRYLPRNDRFKKRMLDGQDFLEKKISRHD